MIDTFHLNDKWSKKLILNANGSFDLLGASLNSFSFRFKLLLYKSFYIIFI